MSEPIHRWSVGGETLCDLPLTPETRGTLANADVTCPDCRREMERLIWSTTTSEDGREPLPAAPERPGRS